jgi:UDP-N-acetylglucosamine 2-epimerase (non-hydrolysing)
MKIASLVRVVRERPQCEAFLVHTGQHYDAAMSESFFRDLGIPTPDVNLGVGSGTHASQTGEVLKRIEPLLDEPRPDAVVVVGDVNSTIAAALAAVKLGIRVAHVEAGLRSFDRTMPEEINRLLTDQISDWLFTTEPIAETNLLNEGIATEKIHFVGNVMVDTLRTNLERAKSRSTLDDLGLTPGGYGLLTLHRPSNVDDPDHLARLFEVLRQIHRDIPLVFPVHPRTKSALQHMLGTEGSELRTIEPQGYLDFLRLMTDAKLVLTDSGGIQEETTVLGVPCLTLRENTERPITTTHGTSTVVGSDPERIHDEVAKILAGNAKRGEVPELWDGRAAERIIDVLVADLR